MTSDQALCRRRGRAGADPRFHAARASARPGLAKSPRLVQSTGTPCGCVWYGKRGDSPCGSGHAADRIDGVLVTDGVAVAAAVERVFGAVFAEERVVIGVAIELVGAA